MARVVPLLVFAACVAPSAGAPVPDPPPAPKKLGRVAGPSPELQAGLAHLDEAYGGRNPERFAELEDEAAGLAKRHPAGDDQARIAAQVANVAALSDIRQHADIVRRYAPKCLAVSRNPLDRARMYSLLASAAEVGGGQFPERRREAAGFLLTGYREMLARELPETAPELPAVERIGGLISGGVDEAQARARHAAQWAARVEAEFVREQVSSRDILVQQLRGLYKPDARMYGRTPAGLEELRALAGQRLTAAQADVLLRRVGE